MTTRQIISIDTAWHPLVDGNPPVWASGWGQDEYGVWVEFSLEGRKTGIVSQRLRWIPAGYFLMGAPKGETSRFYRREGPQHRVSLSKGFWLFDTPVTQALWQTVMGNDPSKFKRPDRPVELVSWDDCQQFIEKINQQIPGLNLSLPGEAGWEYGCRADDPGAIYTGELKIIGDGNAPALDPIAWYGGNSGEDFKLDNGQDISWLKNRQFDSNPCGTHPVALKQPNSWGLYDMLGNVLEWTADSNHDNYQGAPDDGSIWDDEKPGAERVIRGGSWFNGARYCRSAYRYWYEPDSRYDYLGFRCCARVQV